jgi:anti-sigma factor RsiW
VRRFLHRRLVCRQAVELMTAYLEGLLDAGERERLEEHLAGCPHCTEYLAQMRATIEALGRIEPEHLDEPVLDDLVGLYQRWRADEPPVSG